MGPHDGPGHGLEHSTYTYTTPLMTELSHEFCWDDGHLSLNHKYSGKAFEVLKGIRGETHIPRTFPNGLLKNGLGSKERSTVLSQSIISG